MLCLGTCLAGFATISFRAYGSRCSMPFLVQLDVTSAQLLVTDHDFKSIDFRMQLNETVQSLLSLTVVPIFNENDAVSTRKAPYEVWSFVSVLHKCCVSCK